MRLDLVAWFIFYTSNICVAVKFDGFFSFNVISLGFAANIAAFSSLKSYFLADAMFCAYVISAYNCLIEAVWKVEKKESYFCF